MESEVILETRLARLEGRIDTVCEILDRQEAMLLKMWGALMPPAPPAGSGSPSQSKSEKPSEPSTCEAGESVGHEITLVLRWDGEGGFFINEEPHEIESNGCVYPVRSAPRKVWAVQLGKVVEGVFSSRDAADKHLAGVRFPADFTITEYDVADG